MVSCHTCCWSRLPAEGAWYVEVFSDPGFLLELQPVSICSQLYVKYHYQNVHAKKQLYFHECWRFKKNHLFHGCWWCFDFDVVELALEGSSVTLVLVVLVIFAVSLTFVIFATTCNIFWSITQLYSLSFLHNQGVRYFVFTYQNNFQIKIMCRFSL